MKKYNDEDLFSAALVLPAVERDRYLERACGDDRDMLGRLQSLLCAFDDAASFVKERSSVSQAGSIDDTIGDYRLLHELGEGGCGVVYLAEQTAPITRYVALKVIKLGMDTKAVIARFEAERQALALMDHPNIAKVFDAGATAAGRPYFVMELVRGIKITDYCDQVRLNIDERVALFIQVCQAIQHAHYQGIIHRDIKPSNVLVTLHDGVPVAKVIDFGIAKATQGRLTEHTLHTVLEQFVGTPAYVSPEQTTPHGIEIDTRTDVYSLGVLLYELLTGRTPFDTTELMQAGLDGLRKRIREEEPPTPSKRLSTLPDEQMTLASAARHTGGTKLVQQLHRDLDWIVMRCLEKDRARRYQTVHDLSLDLQRYLRHESVLARPPSLIYTVRKFARRNRLIFAAASAGAVFVLFIVAFAITTSVQAQRIAAERDRAEQERARAEQERERAEKVSEFMLRVIAASDPFETHGRTVTAQELLDQAGRNIRADPNQQPEVRARLLEAIGRAYRRQNQYDLATSFLEEALQIRKQLADADVTKTISVMNELAITQRRSGDLKAADRTIREALEISYRHHNERSLMHAELLTNLGRSELRMGKLARARKYLEESLALNRALREPRDPEIAAVLLALSTVSLWNDDLQAAERAVKEAISIYSEKVAPLYPDRVMAELRLAEVLLSQNRVNEAIPLVEKSLEAQRMLYGAQSRQVADVLDSLAWVRRSQGMFAEAEELARQALAIQEVVVGEQHYTTGYLRTGLALHLMGRRKFEEAEAQLRISLEVYAKTLPPDHPYVASAEHLLGELLLERGELEDAEAFLTAAINRCRRADSAPWRAARSASALGEVLYRRGRLLEAERFLTESYRVIVADNGADTDARVKARERVTRFYTDRGQQQKLERLLLASNTRASAAVESKQN